MLVSPVTSLFSFPIEGSSDPVCQQAGTGLGSYVLAFRSCQSGFGDHAFFNLTGIERSSAFHVCLKMP
jgi:hypothetical protein